jgi:hypothetical protein
MTRPVIYSPESIDLFRAQTERLKATHFSNMKTQVCPGCKKSRSLTQFDGKKFCRPCRGLK